MFRQAVSSTRIYQWVFSIGLLLAMFSAIKSMMFGSRTLAIMLGAGLVGAGIILSLNRYYWMLGVFLFGFRDVIPHLRFTGLELGGIIIAFTFFMRRAMHQEPLSRGRNIFLLAAVPFLAWMCLVWSQNPTGMHILGSSTMGGRFYFKVLLAFFSMGCLSALQLTQKECKLLVFSYLLGIFFSLLLRNADTGVVQELQSGGSHYRFADFWLVAAFFLCRYSAYELLTNKWLFLGSMSSLGLAIYSGNRHSAGSAILMGLLAPITLRRDRARTGVLILIGTILLGIVVIGHGRIWSLPFSVQRSLSFLPGKWDRRLENYGFKDEFRKDLRILAHDQIRASPWFGAGGFAITFNDIMWSSQVTQSDREIHAFTRNWHNVWLGMAADFGIPFSVAWAFFMAVLLIAGWKWVRSDPCRSWRQTSMAYFYLIIVITFIDFWFNGGHSAKTPERIFIWAGMLCAAKNSVINHNDICEE